jgi:hypothetical protein
LLAARLAVCADTRFSVSPEYLEHCPVTNERALPECFADCVSCQQRVRLVALEDGRCRACRELRRVRKDNPCLARLLAQYANLDRWRHWQMSETARTYLFSARTLWRCLILVVQKDTLEAVHIALRGRWSKQRWQEIPAAERAAWLGEV